MFSVLKGLFSWLPAPLNALFIGAVAIFVLYGVFKIVVAIIQLVTDIIPGW